MSREQDWRLVSGRGATYNRPALQRPSEGIAGDMRDIPRPVADGRLSVGSDLARSRGRGGRLGSPALLEAARDKSAPGPLGSPALSILAHGRRTAHEATGPQWPEAQQGRHDGPADKPQRSVAVNPPASRSASPADRNSALQDRPGPAPVMSRLGRQKPPRQSLVPVELPPVSPAQATRLHQEILDFCSRVVPNEEEDQRRSAAHAQMLSACRAAKLFNLQPFGSRASGLELWDSDIDLVVLGLVQPSGENHTFFEAEKEEVNFHLGRLCKQLRLTRAMQKMHHIRKARVPIVKCTALGDVDVDVSINDDRGIRAARWLLCCQHQWPALRPLTLLLKAVLRVLELHDVSQGGLGSFSLSNMVIAHLQEEEKDGRDTADLGVLLLTFLMRYGRSFDYDEHAVSVGQGGVILRADLASPIPAGHIVQLIVEDVDTRRDVAGGSYRMGDVAVTFAGAAASCEQALCKAASPSDSLLAAIFGDCCIQKALSREPVNCDPWAAWDPLPLPGSSRRHMPIGTHAAELEQPINGVLDGGSDVRDRLELLSQFESARQPGMRAKRTAVFLDPSSRSSVLQWAKSKYGAGHADSILLAEHPSLRQLAATPLGQKADLLVTGTADDGQVQILVLELPKHLESSSSVAPHFAVSVSDEASADAAGELAESIAAGHRQGIRLDAFPQPRALQGTVGVELETGYMFFHADELGRFWESQDAGAESETDSILAADEEGLGHLHMQAAVAKSDMGFFGALPACAASAELGSNKRKSMELGLRPSHAKPQHRDRWEEGHDPELYNLRRKTSKDDVVGSIPQPSQYVAGMRSEPKAQNGQPQRDLPPHLSEQADSGRSSKAVQADGAPPTVSTEWPSLGGRNRALGPESRNAASIATHSAATTGSQSAWNGSAKDEKGRQPSMTLGRTDGRTLADFMPAPQAGQGQRPGRRGQPGSRAGPRSAALATQQAVASKSEQLTPTEDLPPHLRKR